MICWNLHHCTEAPLLIIHSLQIAYSSYHRFHFIWLTHKHFKLVECWVGFLCLSIVFHPCLNHFSANHFITASKTWNFYIFLYTDTLTFCCVFKFYTLVKLTATSANNCCNSGLLINILLFVFYSAVSGITASVGPRFHLLVKHN